MGTSFHTQLIVGIETDRIIAKRTDTTYVTKYNEDTGEPYQKPVKKKVVAAFGKEWPDEDFHIGDIEELLPCKLELHYGLGDENNLIGIKLHDSGYGYENACQGLSLEELQNYVETVQTLLLGLGLSHCIEHVKIWSVLTYG